MLSLSPEWAVIYVMIFLSICSFVGLLWKVDTGNKKTIATISTGQAIAQVREAGHSADIVTVNLKLDAIMNGESKCKLAFTERISKIEQKTESIQNELSEMKS